MEYISSENDKLKSSHFTLQDDKKALESKYHKLKSHTDVMKADYDRVNAKLSNLGGCQRKFKAKVMDTSKQKRQRKVDC